MKKNFVYAMMSAIALSGAVSFSACSSNEEVADVNPTYDGESVKTQFTISVGDAMSPTRMATTAVQADETFKGMTDIYLFPFKGTVDANALISESYIHLADFTDFDDKVQKAQGKIYKDVNLSVGVNNFLFYGAIVSGEKGNGELKPSYLNMTDPATWNPSPIVKGTTKVGDLTFDLVPINKGKTLTDVQGDAKAIATIKPLNDADEALTTAIAAIAGSTLAETTARDQLVEIQKTLRNENELETGKYTPYAGSSKSILSLMQMLYASLKNLQASLTIGEGASAKDYATDITSVLDESFDSQKNTTTGEWTLAWKTDPKFPETSFGVPDGAAAVQFVTGTGTGTGKFEYVTTSVEGLAVPSIDRYTYPARLYYTVNSPSMVKDAVYLETNVNETNDTWEKVKTAGGYTQEAIKASTRSVIMQNQVQYAVGRLDVNVKVKPETIINDNSKDGGQPVSVPTDGYQLTGVLIGGQKQVGWDFTPISGATEMTIWDKIMTSTTSPITAKQGADFAGPNHTLALETASGTPINIALEFVNTGNDFCGIDHNVIPAGTKFYLVAQLDPSSNSTYKEQNPETPWAEGSAYIKQVIKQDYVTTVNLTIGANSLKSAYNVVPDLRSPKLEFGLSVDLHWRKGITFDVEF